MEQHIGSGIGRPWLKALSCSMKDDWSCPASGRSGPRYVSCSPCIPGPNRSMPDVSSTLSRHNDVMFVVDSDMNENRSEEPSTINVGNAKKTVMLVEDNHELKEMLGAFLAEKYRVITCSNGLDAINMMEAQYSGCRYYGYNDAGEKWHNAVQGDQGELPDIAYSGDYAYGQRR